MARLPTSVKVDNLRFTGNTTLAFTVKWESDDHYAGMIDHIRVRLMMTNLSAVGVDEAAVKMVMEGWDDIAQMGEGLSAPMEIDPPPDMWEDTLVLHRIDYRSPNGIDGDDDNGVDDDDNVHEEAFTIMDTSFQQRFVRLIAQARTAD